MDAFSGDAELLNITTAFHTHDYLTVLSYDTSPLSSRNKQAAQLLKFRAQIALGQTREVLSSLGSRSDSASQALRSLAQHATNNDTGVDLATQLASSDPEDPVVQICCGTVLASSPDHVSAAIDVLSKHQGNLEAVTLLTQIYLSQNRTDLALKEVSAAKRWAQDNLLINLAEAWVNLRTGPTEKYQSTYYVYEELAGAPGNHSVSSLVGQAVAEVHLGRLPEAEAALNQAMTTSEEKGQLDAEAVANSLVLACVMGKRSEEIQALKGRLREVAPEHALMVDIQDKSHIFDSAAAKYTSKVAA